ASRSASLCSEHRRRAETSACFHRTQPLDIPADIDARACATWWQTHTRRSLADLGYCSAREWRNKPERCATYHRSEKPCPVSVHWWRTELEPWSKRLLTVLEIQNLTQVDWKVGKASVRGRGWR